jgi:hypothetical protein
MLGSIETDSTETNAHQVSKVGSDSLADIVSFCIEIEETTKPAIVKLEGIGPRAKTTVAMEICSDVRYSWEFIARLKASVV